MRYIVAVLTPRELVLGDATPKGQSFTVDGIIEAGQVVIDFESNVEVDAVAAGLAEMLRRQAFGEVHK